MLSLRHSRFRACKRAAEERSKTRNQTQEVDGLLQSVLRKRGFVFDLGFDDLCDRKALGDADWRRRRKLVGGRKGNALKRHAACQSPIWLNTSVQAETKANWAGGVLCCVWFRRAGSYRQTSRPPIRAHTRLQLAAPCSHVRTDQCREMRVMGVEKCRGRAVD